MHVDIIMGIYSTYSVFARDILCFCAHVRPEFPCRLHNLKCVNKMRASKENWAEHYGGHALVESQWSLLSNISTPEALPAK